MIRHFLIAAALVVTGLAGMAAPAGAADVWVMNPDKSRLQFTATRGGEDFRGSFGRFDVGIVFSPDNLEGSNVTAFIEMASVSTAISDINLQLPTADWFHVAEYPDAKWESTSFEHLGGVNYRAMGDLTLKGVTREVPIDFTLEINGDFAVMKGRADLLRTRFNVGEGEWAEDDLVDYEVVVHIEIHARRQNGNAPGN